MKKFAVITLALIMALSLAACGAASSAASETVLTPSSVAASSVPASSVAESTADSGDTHTVSGTIANLAMSTITINGDDGQQYGLLHDGIDFPDNCATGRQVTVTYTGDASDSTAELTDIELADGTITGTISDASMNTFTLNMPDGTVMQILLDDNTKVDLPEGISDGIEVTVSYHHDKDLNGDVATSITAAE